MCEDELRSNTRLFGRHTLITAVALSPRRLHIYREKEQHSLIHARVRAHHSPFSRVKARKLTLCLRAHTNTLSRNVSREKTLSFKTTPNLSI